MSDRKVRRWRLAAASPALPATLLPLNGYAAESAKLSAPEAPRAEWAAEAIVNLRHVVAGITIALVIEGAIAFAIIATWNLWHIR